MNNKLKNKRTKTIIQMVSSFFIGIICILLLERFLPINSYSTSINDTTLQEQIKKINPSVVIIKSDESSIGSGFIYKVDKNNAYILTNEHVVTNKKKVNVELITNKKAKATVLGKDSYLDLAVLKIDKKYATKPVKLGNSKKINVGDSIFTIGTPIAEEYKNTVTSGIISGLDRAVKTQDSSGNDIIMNMIQIDAPINSGNSGGPLVNLNGEVIGICTLKITDANVESLGFAVPVNIIKDNLDNLESSKNIKYPSLGVDVIDTFNGIQITKVNNNIPLKENDIIIKINNKEVEDSAHLKYEIYKYKIGKKIKVTYTRNDVEKETNIVLK